MLEGLVAWVLNNYLGKYVENLNTDQLSVALLSGKVELENLPLKKDALRHLGLPVEIKAGFIGKVQLQVPVRQIRSAPWLIAIEKLYLVATPVNLDEWDSAAEATYAHERKVALLDALEAQWRAEHEAADAGYYATSYSSWLSYGTGLLANIVENLQLKLHDVHIRYEEAGGGFACGLTVAALAAESCDAEWRRGFTLLADPDGCSFKLLELQRLAVYWDPMPVPAGMLADCTISELTERMSETWKASHRYLVSPASAHARVRRERTEQPLRARARPRLAAHLTLDTVLLNLTSRQYKEAVASAVGLQRLSRLRECRALRPAAPVRGHARLWWIYALSAHVPHHPWTEPAATWESCLAAGRASRGYVAACLATLAQPAATLPPDVKAAKDEFEWRTPLHVLKALREVAMRKVPKSCPVSTPDRPSSGRSMLVHWFPQWWGWYGPPAAPDLAPTPAPAPAPAPTPADLEEEILDVIADSLDNNTLLKRDTVFGKFEFVLNKGSLNLTMDDGDEDNPSGASSPGGGGGGGGAVELAFSEVRAEVESRPRGAAHAFHVSLGELCLKDRVTPRTLFPVICAPQGVIREALCALSAGGAPARCRAHNAPPPHAQDPLFQLSYEKRPLNANCDYKLWVRSGSIEVVYCPEVARWARSFVSAPWGAGGVPALHAYHSVRDSTRATIMTHWEHIMRPGDRGERRSWQVELDISAPQILFAESLCSREAAVLLVDFGRLRLANAPRAPPPAPPAPPDEEEQFMTPCSTPPGSLLSPADPSPAATLDAQNLHDRLYDRYEVELSSLQVLVGRARDSWQYAHTKPTSALHLLDRFSIALVAERRAVRTCDPGYPAATLQAHLPALVAHLSEHKLCAVRAVLANLPLRDLHSGQPAAAPGLVDDETSCSSDTERSEAAHNSTLLMLQFMVDQMSLEVQSLGRSIAEVQVCGVRASAARRPRDTSLSLSVHSLLLVDALQTYGPDFELLVASHKHVGMDTASGSILGSEPTSPTSPVSPHAPPNPHALSQALHALYHTHNYRGASEVERASPAPSWVTGGVNSTAPTWGGNTWGGGTWGAGTWGAAGAAAGCNWGAAGLVDSEALIAVELCLVKGDADSEDLRIANILFNNLDIIANQETIVELIGFCQRVAGPHSGAPAAAPRAAAPRAHAPPHSVDMQKAARTEITFDFHRLGVLLLRAAVHEGAVVARKIATATVCEARIQATLDGSQVCTTGSLGGVHVVSLCEGGGVHSRVLSAGTAATHHHAPLDALDAHHDERALFFTVQRTLLASEDGARPAVEASLVMKVARVWYTHSPALLLQLRSCLAEFKQYLANLARSIRAAAADMALGLVHPRESLYLNPKLSGSAEGVSPRRRTISLGASLDDPPDLQDNIVLSVSIELESPVVVVPRGAHSTQVLVAHLGRMSLSNRPGPPRNTLYTVRVRDISLHSLDVAEKVSRLSLTAESMRRVYDVRCGRPVLHNTALKLTLNLGDHQLDTPCQCVISGGVVGPLQVSARRDQYEQLLDTLRWISGGTQPASDVHPDVPPTPAANMSDSSTVLEPAVPTLQLDPAVRAAVLAVPPPVPPVPPAAPPAPPPLPLIVNFELPMFSVELRADLGTGERSLVDLSFREFALSYKKTNEYETTLQVSLHSITMEDLTKEPESKHRMMMVSHTPQMPPKAVFVSKSCPDFLTGRLEDDLEDFSSLQYSRASSRSLPSQLNVTEKKERRNKRQDSKCGPTPPCSPECGPAGVDAEEDDAGEGLAADDNLVWVWVHTRDPTHPRFRDKYNKVSKLTKVEFNCLNLVVSIDSWVTVLDFFGVAGDDACDAPADAPPDQRAESSTSPTSCGITQTDVSVRSLSVVVVGGRGEVCRALVSRVRVAARAEPALGARATSGRLGALVLADLTPRAPLWRDTLRTAHHQALTFQYNRLSAAEAAAAGHETSLKLEMGPVTYVHTRRFVHELQEFARDFSLLRRVITQARHKVSVASGLQEPGSAARMLVRVVCEAPCIILPVSGRCRAALAAQLARLDLSNCFKHAGDPGTVSTLTDSECPDRELLDVRSVQLSSLTLRPARGGPALRLGAPLLTEPAHLTLHIEQNLSQTHNVPDMTVHGTLTKLECALDPAQYRLVRGVLQHNLGEVVGEPHPPPPPHHCLQVWTTSSLKLELQDVALRLEPVLGQSSLACINFIKSRLVLDTYSDTTRDIDLVSQEILVSDTRYANEPANRRGNVFTNIVQPMPDHRHSVQAEVHARTHREYCAYTILVNNMRLMAVLEWWERAHQFLTQPPHAAADGDQPPLEETSPVTCGGAHGTQGTQHSSEAPTQMELKLNITDSQLVLVEDASVWDTNAVILRSTTVITYRLADPEKPISCSLNELEVFSCVLGLEEETALSIVEPAALHVVLDAQRVLHVSTSTLDLRLSYHDMRMFASMLQSLPVQARAALSGNAVSMEVVPDAPANSVHMQAGAGPPRWAIAPRWLRSAPPPPPSQPAQPSPVWPLKAVQVTAECITLCVIDDCLDSDVPLLEVALTDLQLEQDLRKVEEAFEDPVLVSTPCAAGGGPRAAGAGGGRLGAVLSVDYYNRTLSGWEPCVEPWRFETTWEYTLSSVLSLARVQISVTSSEMLNTTVTSSLLSLWQLVRANWAADYYAPQTSSGAEQSPKGSPAGHRRRSPFVPYALRNHTGHRLWFTTLITSSDVLREQTSWSGPDDSWQGVRAGDTEPFSFGGRRGARGAGGGRSHAHQLHQLALRLDGWDPPDPVCVDRVGVFFRNLTHSKTGAEARIVFEVSLEGSARKLVTVRSALQLVNKLPHPVEVRVDHAPSHESPRGCYMRRQVRVACASLQRARALRAALAAPPPTSRDTHPMFVNCAQWTGSGVRSAQVAAGGAWAAPLAARPGVLWTRPLVPGAGAPPAPAPVDWRAAGPLVHHECRAPPDHVYRFCCVTVRERFPPDKGPPVAGHTLTLVPALRLENLLPLELQYRLSSPGARAGAAPPADTVPFHQVNVEEGVELSVKLEGFGWSTPLSVGGAGGGGSFSARLKLRDTRGRRLYLNARVTMKKTDGIKVSISAPYWLVNRTGLPLVFRAEGAAGEAAGQFAEHEVARMVAPLLFSFAEAAGPTLAARLGHGLPGTPEWCSPFGLGPGVGVKKLETRGEGEGAERVFAVGVSVRSGRARYRHTNIVTFTPRYQLHNNTTHHLQFAQKCTATTLNDPGAMATHVSAVAGCYLPWHWARWERPHLLCVRLLRAGPGAAPATAWSAGFRVDTARSLTVPCREAGGGYQFVRVEVASQGATLFVVLTDGETAPPPLAIHNYSPVSIMFHQVGCSEECAVGAHGSVRWALPEPEGAAALALRAPGGPRTTLPLAALGSSATLLYQNFIYVAFTATHHRDSPGGGGGAASEEGALVLEVPLGSTRVVLARKRYGDRCQLWRRGPNEQLIHEGSSVPQPTDVLLADDAPLSPHSMVLDIEDAAPRPGRASWLVLRRADGRRASTQAWRLLRGRMCCAHSNLCVQPDGLTLQGLQVGARVVLGMAGGGGGGAAAAEQAVSWHTLRPGSGRLAVSLAADGPTRRLTIRDQKDPESGWLENAEEGEGLEGCEGGREWGLAVSLAGLSVSVVARVELVNAVFSGLALAAARAPAQLSADLRVSDMQWDNQLLGTTSPVLLCCVERGGGAALHAALELQRAAPAHHNAYCFKHLCVAARPVAVRLEERLILQLWWWAWGEEDEAGSQPDEAEFETRRMLDELTALHATRYYFALIKIMPSQIRLSMTTASKLEGSLSALKRRLGLTLIKFEDACVELEPFERHHVFDTASYLTRQMYAHFKEELKWQAAKILGSVDFLGNPLGFVADVSEGVSGLLLEGNVAALLQNVTHGLSNSAAKVSESLGDGLERVVGDEAHEETRRRIRSEAGGAHLAAGLRHLGLGLLGGATSLVKHSYEGAAREGLAGFLAGVGKGLVGTVTKPVIGVLDLAADTAAAVRESSRRADRRAPARVRGPRCAAGAGGLLPRYCGAGARGAALLYALNEGDHSERFLAYRLVRDTPHDIRALLSDAYVRMFTCKHGAPHVLMETHLSNLVSCCAVEADGASYVELGVRGGGGEAVRRPRVQCDSPHLAAWVARHAALARQLYHEHVHTLHPHTDI